MLIYTITYLTEGLHKMKNEKTKKLFCKKKVLVNRDVFISNLIEIKFLIL